MAGALVREKGLPWRTAHQIVGILVRLSNERRLKPNQATPELLVWNPKKEQAVIYKLRAPMYFSGTGW